jgi:hypothetical protein
MRQEFDQNAKELQQKSDRKVSYFFQFQTYILLCFMSAASRLIFNTMNRMLSLNTILLIQQLIKAVTNGFLTDQGAARRNGLASENRDTGD